MSDELEDEPKDSNVNADRYVVHLVKSTDTLIVDGSVDELSCDRLREDLRHHTDDYSKGLVVDLSGVSTLPSRTVGVLVGAQRACATNGHVLTLRTSRGCIAQRVLTMLGLPHEVT